MRIFKSKSFSRLQKKEKFSDKALTDAVKEMEKGLFDANLGSDLYKKRIPRPGEGKSGGFRTLVAARVGEKYFFIYVFAKKDRANINAKEEDSLKELAQTLISLGNKQIDIALQQQELFEVTYE